ncbi:MAG: heme-binding protein [Planctomycetota bacterium]|nr:heme-binding protein [Planctomycetota bacterium]
MTRKTVRNVVIVAGAVAMAIVSTMWNLGCSAVGIRTWEERAHRTVLDEGRYELRVYEPALIARATSDKPFDEASDETFGKLGGFIFGKNAEGESIAMTMPVERVALEPGGPADASAGTPPANAEGALVSSDRNRRRWQMAFFMPGKYTRETLPTPNTDAVQIDELEPETLAIYRYSGVQHEDDLARHEAGLREWIRAKGYEATGPARLAAYDPPWTMPFLRRNEVLIPVREPGADPEPAEAPVQFFPPRQPS